VVALAAPPVVEFAGHGAHATAPGEDEKVPEAQPTHTASAVAVHGDAA